LWVTSRSMAQDAASAQPAPRRGSIFGDILVGAHFTAFDTHEEQVASRHKGDLERLRLSAANDSVPWFDTAQGSSEMDALVPGRVQGSRDDERTALTATTLERRGGACEDATAAPR
jgi:hypothetical protein